MAAVPFIDVKGSQKTIRIEVAKKKDEFSFKVGELNIATDAAVISCGMTLRDEIFNMEAGTAGGSCGSSDIFIIMAKRDKPPGSVLEVCPEMTRLSR